MPDPPSADHPRSIPPPTIAPMLAKLTPEIPEGEGWHFEPKWDGFRCIVFFDGAKVFLQSRDLKPLGRYFPELETSLASVLPHPCVLDGEIVIMGTNGLEFETLQLRLHPAASRVNKLAAETPSDFVAFDLLGEGDEDLRGRPFGERRARLEALIGELPRPLHITPATDDRATAQDWFDRFEGAGFDGVIAKRLGDTYQPNKRIMQKIKHLRTVDCVVGGYRWNKGEEGKSIGAILLGLYDAAGVLNYVGHSSSFNAAEKKELLEKLHPYETDDEAEGFGQGRTPGGASRWSTGKDTSWVRLRPELVCEVTFDYLQGERFRHAATFRHWRPDKPPTACTFDQMAATVPFELQQVFDKR